MIKPRKWPVPGDTPLDRARRVAQTYRTALRHLDPATANQVDAHITALGETWITPTPVTYDLNTDYTPQHLSEHLGGTPTPAAIRQWRTRGHIPQRYRDGKAVNTVQEVLDYQASVRAARARRDQTA